MSSLEQVQIELKTEQLVPALLIPLLLMLNGLGSVKIAEARPILKEKTIAEKQVAKNYNIFLKELRKNKSVQTVAFIINKKGLCGGVTVKYKGKDFGLMAEHCTVNSSLTVSNQQDSAISKLSKPIVFHYQREDGTKGSVSESLVLVDLQKTRNQIKVIRDDSKLPSDVGSGFKSEVVNIDSNNPVCKNFDVNNPIVKKFNGPRNRGTAPLIDLFLRKNKKPNSTDGKVELLVGNSGSMAFGMSKQNPSKHCFIGSLSSVQQSYQDFHETNSFSILRMTPK